MIRKKVLILVFMAVILSLSKRLIAQYGPMGLASSPDDLIFWIDEVQVPMNVGEPINFVNQDNKKWFWENTSSRTNFTNRNLAVAYSNSIKSAGPHDKRGSVLITSGEEIILKHKTSRTGAPINMFNQNNTDKSYSLSLIYQPLTTKKNGILLSFENNVDTGILKNADLEDHAYFQISQVKTNNGKVKIMFDVRGAGSSAEYITFNKEIDYDITDPKPIWVQVQYYNQIDVTLNNGSTVKRNIFFFYINGVYVNLGLSTTNGDPLFQFDSPALILGPAKDRENYKYLNKTDQGFEAGIMEVFMMQENIDVRQRDLLVNYIESKYDIDVGETPRKDRFYQNSGNDYLTYADYPVAMFYDPNSVAYANSTNAIGRYNNHFVYHSRINTSTNPLVNTLSNYASVMVLDSRELSLEIENLANHYRLDRTSWKGDIIPLSFDLRFDPVDLGFNTQAELENFMSTVLMIGSTSLKGNGYEKYIRGKKVQNENKWIYELNGKDDVNYISFKPKDLSQITAKTIYWEDQISDIIIEVNDNGYFTGFTAPYDFDYSFTNGTFLEGTTVEEGDAVTLDQITPRVHFVNSKIFSDTPNVELGVPKETWIVNSKFMPNATNGQFREIVFTNSDPNVPDRVILGRIKGPTQKQEIKWLFNKDKTKAHTDFTKFNGELYDTEANQVVILDDIKATSSDCKAPNNFSLKLISTNDDKKNPKEIPFEFSYEFNGNTFKTLPTDFEIGTHKIIGNDTDNSKKRMVINFTVSASDEPFFVDQKKYESLYKSKVNVQAAVEEVPTIFYFVKNDPSGTYQIKRDDIIKESGFDWLKFALPCGNTSTLTLSGDTDKDVFPLGETLLNLEAKATGGKIKTFKLLINIKEVELAKTVESVFYADKVSTNNCKVDLASIISTEKANKFPTIDPKNSEGLPIDLSTGSEVLAEVGSTFKYYFLEESTTKNKQYNYEIRIVDNTLRVKASTISDFETFYIHTNDNGQRNVKLIVPEFTVDCFSSEEDFKKNYAIDIVLTKLRPASNTTGANYENIQTFNKVETDVRVMEYSGLETGTYRVVHTAKHKDPVIASKSIAGRRTFDFKVAQLYEDFPDDQKHQLSVGECSKMVNINQLVVNPSVTLTGNPSNQLELDASNTAYTYDYRFDYKEFVYHEDTKKMVYDDFLEIRTLKIEVLLNKDNSFDLEDKEEEFLIELNENGKNVDFTKPVFSAICDDVIKISESHQPQDFFPIGETIVKYEARLVSDQSLLDTWEYKINVKQKPEIENKAPIISSKVFETDFQKPVVIQIDATDPEDDNITLVSATTQDGNISELDEDHLNFTFTPKKEFSGGASIVLKVCDDDQAINCSEKELIVNVSTKPPIITYKAITPNGDQINDLWEIENIEFYGNNKIQIMDRWGSIVYEMKNYDNKAKVWDGSRNVGGNSVLARGTYFYVITLENTGNQIKGFLEIIK